jgi:hypothetical protein
VKASICKNVVILQIKPKSESPGMIVMAPDRGGAPLGIKKKVKY